MDKTEEIKRIIETASQGNWIPLTIVIGVLGCVVLLLIYIWKQNIRKTEEKFSRHDEWLNKLSQNSDDHTKIITKLEIMSEIHEIEIKELKNA